jgi:hypothetical protein
MAIMAILFDFLALTGASCKVGNITQKSGHPLAVRCSHVSGFVLNISICIINLALVIAILILSQNESERMKYFLDNDCSSYII